MTRSLELKMRQEVYSLNAPFRDRIGRSYVLVIYTSRKLLAHFV